MPPAEAAVATVDPPTIADAVVATVDIRYLDPSLKGQERVSYTAETRAEVTRAYGVLLHDGRRGAEAGEAASRAQLKRRGFALVNPFRSSVCSDLHRIENPAVYRSDKAPESPASASARGVYFRECEQLVQDLTGAHVAFHISHAVRNGAGNKKSSGVEYLTAYATFAHSDYTMEVLPHAWKMLTKRGIPEAMARRMEVAIINVWQPTQVPVEQHPLALLDWNSVDPEDVVSVTLGYAVTPKAGQGSVGPPIAQLTHNPRHAWFFFPHLQTDEALVFTQVDSRRGYPQHCFHTAVKHAVKPDPVERSSVEVRVLCGFLPPEERRQASL